MLIYKYVENNDTTCCFSLRLLAALSAFPARLALLSVSTSLYFVFPSVCPAALIAALDCRSASSSLLLDSIMPWWRALSLSGKHSLGEDMAWNA